MRYIDATAAIIGGASAAVALAVGIPVAPALAIGIGALLIASGGRLAAILHPTPHVPQHAPTRPPPLLHPDDQRLVAGADHAVVAIRRAIDSVGDGPLRERFEGVAGEAQRVAADLRRLAAQMTATRAATAELEVPRLSTDLDRLTTTLRGSDDLELVRDLQRSVDAVREQLLIGARLTAARRALQARIESGVLGVQQLAAQVAEMTALAPAETSLGQHQRIDALTTQLEALRAGLSDAGARSRSALGALDPAIDPEGGHDDPLDP